MEKSIYAYPRKGAIIWKQQNFQNKRIPKVKAYQKTEIGNGVWFGTDKGSGT